MKSEFSSRDTSSQPHGSNVLSALPAPDIAFWSRLTVDIVAAATLERLQEVALRGALDLSGAQNGALSLYRDEFDSQTLTPRTVSAFPGQRRATSDIFFCLQAFPCHSMIWRGSTGRCAGMASN